MVASSIPLPFVVSPTGAFDGNDGSWSTFSIAVGTPQQLFRVLPSTASSETWIPVPQACEGALINVTDCGDLRGVNNFDNVASSGFQTNASTTWDTIGIYELSTEQNLFGTSNTGLYGFDTVTLFSPSSSTGQNASDQTVAGIATEDFWLGSLGLGTYSANFSVKNTDTPSLMETLKNDNLIPSLSFGYSAGASYSSPKDTGGLVLGGYDRSRMSGTNLTTPLTGASNRTLALSIQSIVAENAFGGTTSLMSDGSTTTVTVDSTVSQLWLPQSICDEFAKAFGLTYDASTELYLVNSTIHRQLLQMGPEVTFTIASNGSSSETINIVLPYAAFDLNASLPMYSNNTLYFPIHVAADASQYTLGRAFLQEAYVFVDWERQHFSLAQAVHQGSPSDIVPVTSPSTSGNTSTAPAISTGAIAGIAVAAFVVLAVAIGLLILFMLRARRRRKAAVKATAQELPSDPTEELSGARQSGVYKDDVKSHELLSPHVHELGELTHKSEAMSSPLSELEGLMAGQELEDRSAEHEAMKKGKLDHSVYELP